MQIKLTTVTPKTKEEFEPYRDDLIFLAHFFPFKLPGAELTEFIDTRIGSITLCYVNQILFGAFAMDVSKNSVELHAVVRPDANKLIPNYKRVKAYITRLVFNDIFLTMKRSKIVIRAEHDNKSVRGFAIMNGFKKLDYPDNGRDVYLLTYKKYIDSLNRKSNVQRSVEYNPVNLPVSV